MTKLTKEDVKKVANLIKLHLGEGELLKSLLQLETSLEPMRVFDELDLTNVKPTAQTTGTVNRLADDIVKPGLSQEEALMNAKKILKGYIVVKRFVKNEH